MTDNLLLNDEQEASEETVAFFQNILNWTFPGAALYYRDTELSESVIAQYSVGQIIRSQVFVDVSSAAGKPTKNCRYAIASSKAAELYNATPANQDIVRWAMHTINADSYFKVLDIYKKDGKTQIFLLHIPAKGIELFQKSVIQIDGIDLEKQFVERARASFDKRLEMPANPELEDDKWTTRTCLPVGMNSENRFFPLVSEVDIFDIPDVAELYWTIHTMTNDNELNDAPSKEIEENTKTENFGKIMNALAQTALDENPPNYERAFLYYQMAAEKGDAEAHYNLGVFYYNGYGTEKDLLLAAYRFKQAGDRNFHDAQQSMLQATLWYFAENIDQWNEEELFKAAITYQKVLYNEENAVESANMLLHVIATSYFKKQKQDFPNVLKCYRAIAEYGNDSNTMCFLAKMYASGEGAEKNLSLAVHWAKKAYEQGHEDGESLYMEYQKLQSGSNGWLRGVNERMKRLFQKNT